MALGEFDAKEYWRHRLGEAFNLGGVGYQALGTPFNKWLYRLRRSTFFQTVRRLDLSWADIRVLDVGVGTGFYLECWARLGVRDISGLDIAQVAVDHARRRYPHGTFRVLDIGEAINPQSGRYDVISAFDVLFHVVEDTAFTQALRNISHMLKTGGYFIWSDNFIHRGALRGTHQVCRNLADIHHRVEDLGFDILSRRPMFWLMNAPVDTESRILKVWWHLLSRCLERAQWLGGIAGGLLYPLERLLVSQTKESPTTEIMVCRWGGPRA